MPEVWNVWNTDGCKPSTMQSRRNWRRWNRRRKKAERKAVQRLCTREYTKEDNNHEPSTF